MNNSDEELQERVEKGLSSETTPDAIAYKRIFEVLGKDPYPAYPQLADRILRKAEARKSGLQTDYFWFGAGLFLLLFAAIVVIAKSDFRPDFGAFRFVQGYAGLFVFALVFILLIQYLDRQLIRKKVSA